VPYPNFHSCRLAEPDSFDPNGMGRGIKFKTVVSGILNIIIGKLPGHDKSTTQAYRYSIKDWTEDAARKHCQDNDGRFEPAKKE